DTGRRGLTSPPAAGRRRGLRRRVGHRARSVHRRPVEPEALAVADLLTDDLLGLVGAVAVVVEHPARKVVFLRDDEPALGIEREDDVAVGAVDRIDAFDREIGKGPEADARDGAFDESLELVLGQALRTA